MEPVSPEPLILLRITIHSLIGWIKQQVAHCNVRFWHCADGAWSQLFGAEHFTFPNGKRTTSIPKKV